jgi:hypothetical protein
MIHAPSQDHGIRDKCCQARARAAGLRAFIQIILDSSGEDLWAEPGSHIADDSDGSTSNLNQARRRISLMTRFVGSRNRLSFKLAT